MLSNIQKRTCPNSNIELRIRIKWGKSLTVKFGHIEIEVVILCFYEISPRIIARLYSKGRTYVMITYVSKENNLGPDDCKAQLVRTNFLYPYQMLSFYEIKPFTRALRNTDHQVCVPKCPGKWLHFINQGPLFKIDYINTG